MCKNEELAAEASVAIDDAALAATFETVTEPMRGLFAQARTAECATDYMRALATAPEAGSMWGLAEAVGHASPGRFQALVREAAWNHPDLIEQINARVRTDLAGPEGGVLIVDETAALKHGSCSVGVSNQHAGVTGRLENC